jgi:hypothetical protein
MKHFLLLPCLSLLVSCATTTQPAGPQDRFFANLKELCGKTFAGAVVTNEAADADLAGKPMVMHVNHCSDSEIRIPFHIRIGSKDVANSSEEAAWDRSRTWVITRTPSGLRLKHDHRHKDGTFDAVTQYGGDSGNEGSSTRQKFPVDAESITNFRANGLARSVTNVWSVERTNRQFVYELRRVGKNASNLI